LQLVTQISEKTGEINANLLDKPSPTSRKQSRMVEIKGIQLGKTNQFVLLFSVQ